MAERKKGEALFGRGGKSPSVGRTADSRRKAREEAVSRLCGNADFRAWLYDALDDLCLFERDEGVLTEFGQGIRAAAMRLRNRLLESKEAVGMLAEFAKRELTEFHRGVKDARKENEK